MNPASEHKATRKVLRILNGTRSATPTLAIPNFLPFGLLYFLNEKQSQLQRLIAKDFPEIQLYGNPNTSALQSSVEFMNFIVGGLIVEAERVDEMVIHIRKQLVLLTNETQCLEMDLHLTRRALSSGVQQTLATHYKQPLSNRPHHAYSDETMQQLHSMTSSLQDKQALIARLKQHLKVSVKVQKMLHGTKDTKTIHALPQENASDLIADMSVLLSFRKAQHYVRDAVYDVRSHEGDSLAAVSSLQEFLDYVDWGMSAALDELEASEMRLRKLVKMRSTEEQLSDLDRRDVDNKQMSCAALKYNQAIAQSPRAQSVTMTNNMPPVKTATFVASSQIGMTVNPHAYSGGLHARPGMPGAHAAAAHPQVDPRHGSPSMTPPVTNSATPFQGAGGFVYTPPTFLTNPRNMDTSVSQQPQHNHPDAFLDAMCF